MFRKYIILQVTVDHARVVTTLMHTRGVRFANCALCLFSLRSYVLFSTEYTVKYFNSANRSEIQATATNKLALPQLPLAARGCHKFKEISLPLISVPKLCQAGCHVNFSTDKVDVTTKHGKHKMTGVMDPTRNLYLFPIPTRDQGPKRPNTIHTVANAYTICRYILL